MHHFERYRAAQAFLDGFIHGGHAAATDLLQDLVAVAQGVGYEVDAGEGGLGESRKGFWVANWIDLSLLGQRNNNDILLLSI